MFDLVKYLDAPFSDPAMTVTHGPYDFAIRRLNGAERLIFNDLPNQYERVKFALANALLTSPDNRAIGESAALKLLERSGALAEALFNDIYDLTERSLQEEIKLWNDVKKKSNEEKSTSTNS